MKTYPKHPGNPLTTFLVTSSCHCTTITSSLRVPRYYHRLADMSSRTAAGRKRLQQPIVSPHDSEQLVNRPNSFTTTTRADLISSTPRSRDVPRVHTSVQRLDLSNQFTQHLPSQAPEYSHTYFPPSNHVNFRNIESNRAVDAVPSYGPFPLRVDPLGMAFSPLSNHFA